MPVLANKVHSCLCSKQKEIWLWQRHVRSMSHCTLSQCCCVSPPLQVVGNTTKPKWSLVWFNYFYVVILNVCVHCSSSCLSLCALRWTGELCRTPVAHFVKTFFVHISLLITPRITKGKTTKKVERKIEGKIEVLKCNLSWRYILALLHFKTTDFSKYKEWCQSK